MFIHLFAVLPIVEVLPVKDEVKDHCKGGIEKKELQKLGLPGYGWKIKALSSINRHFEGIDIKYCPQAEGLAKRCLKYDIDDPTVNRELCRPFSYTPSKHSGTPVKRKDIAFLLGPEYDKYCYDPLIYRRNRLMYHVPGTVFTKVMYIPASSRTKSAQLES
ncbi:unnamed protein product [Cylicocyclus nassatus]|uniref:Uncharacterized protein n=1 Tax=Cylicocyclus nassatus TaxID=53992 RepID=A0AA36DS86_CYLNA|nr:unnamed protein product [Cylicocyclus nassatus]